MTTRVVPHSGTFLSPTRIPVSPLLYTFINLVFPLLRAKDLLACSSTCREWRQITGNEEVYQTLWTSLWHRDFINAYSQPKLCSAYDYYAMRSNGCTLKLEKAEKGDIFEASIGIISVSCAYDRLLIRYKSGAIKIWDLETKNCLASFNPKAEVSACFFNEDYLVLGLNTGHLMGWSIQIKEPIEFTQRHSSSVVAFSESKKYFLSLSKKGEVILWDRSYFSYVDRSREWVYLNLFKQPCLSIKTALFASQMLIAISEANEAYALTGFDDQKLNLLVESMQAPMDCSIDAQMMSYSVNGTLRLFDFRSKSFAMVAQNGECLISSLSLANTRFILNSIKNGHIEIIDLKWVEKSIAHLILFENSNFV